MKSRFLIIIGIIAVIVVSLSSFAIYESSTVVFVSCDPRYEQIDDKCVKKVNGRENDEILELYKDAPEVVAFYAKYADAQVSVREDHISYFAGNEDDFRVRMNLEFDENYEIENIEFHCYVQREHQTEVSQTFILRYLKDWTCNEYGSQRNEN